MQLLEHDRRQAARERQALADATAKLKSREDDLKNREEALRRKLDQKIEERLREARREIDAVVGRLKARTETMVTQADRAAARLIPTGESGGARAGRTRRAGCDRGPPAPRCRRRRDRAGRTAPADARRAGWGSRARGGARPRGCVISLHGRDAEVDVRGKRLRARVADLRVTAASRPAAPAPYGSIDPQPREGLLSELNLIGSNVDDALVRLEKFLDDASITEQRTVRVIHGFGPASCGAPSGSG